MLKTPEYTKILKYRKDSAKLYYVEQGMTGGHVLCIAKQNGIWTVVEWRTIWSDTGGSASGIIYPYLWHFIYGGI